MTAKEAYHQLCNDLEQIYESREAGNIADWVLEFLTGKKKWERHTENLLLTKLQLGKLYTYSDELLRHKPVQYVLGEAWFCGMRFLVNENVLIPRPETEELVQTIVNDQKTKNNTTILDIGTGSGCITIALKKKLPLAEITSIDISEAAINIATQNALLQKADINFQCMDFLDQAAWSSLPQFEIIVSNPPYIPSTEKKLLNKNVVDFEPGVALFVPNNEGLLFYKAIEEFSGRHLKKNGKIYLEVHENFAKHVHDHYSAHGWHATILKDIYGKERIVTATLM